MIKQPERLNEMMDVLVSATELQYLQAMAELDKNEVKAENMKLALVRAEIGDKFFQHQ